MGTQANGHRPASDSEDVGAAAYRLLMGCDQADAAVEEDVSFDRHVLASILAVAAMEDGTVAERAGLANSDLITLIEREFPCARDVIPGWCAPVDQADDEEMAMVRDLLLVNRSADSDLSRWLSAMVARRAMEPNHLWEDLGLRDREELTRLLDRHFGPIAGKNTKNMKWKRFFYRSMCESDGFVMCSTPVCTQCADFSRCYGDESGESRLAQRRRDMALKDLALNVNGASLDGVSSPST
jgi:nitrogen fixation protein NifQ